MYNQNMSITEKDILSEFEERAFQIIDLHKDHFMQYNALFGDKQFQADKDTVRSILNKYGTEKEIDFAFILRYEEFVGYLGDIEIEETDYHIWVSLFETDEGINVIKKILDLIDIEYGCKRKRCLVRASCRVTEHSEECKEEVDDLRRNPFNYAILRDIIDLMNGYAPFQLHRL